MAARVAKRPALILWPGVDAWPGRHRIVRLVTGEWRWPLVVALLLVAFDVPFRLAGLFGSAHGQTFSGMIWAPHDAAQYLSAMRQGAAGGWLIYDRLSPEPHDPVLMYPLYVVLGKLSAALSMSIEATFLAAGTGARLAFLLALYAFARCLTPDVTQRRLIFVLVPTVSGLALVLGIASTLSGSALTVAARELNDPEVSSFLLLLTAPHLILRLALVFAAVTIYTRAWGEQPAHPARSTLLGAAIMGLLGLN